MKPRVRCCGPGRTASARGPRRRHLSARRGPREGRVAQVSRKQISSWPSIAGRGRGGGRGPSPAWASARAISSRVVAIFTRRMGPVQCGHTITSTANTRAKSHAHGVEKLARAPAATRSVARASRHRRPTPVARARSASSRRAPARPRRGPPRGPRARRDSAACESVAEGSERRAARSDRAGRAGWHTFRFTRRA
jgi:hypothetical protein